MEDKNNALKIGIYNFKQAGTVNYWIQNRVIHETKTPLSLRFHWQYFFCMGFGFNQLIIKQNTMGKVTGIGGIFLNVKIRK